MQEHLAAGERNRDPAAPAGKRDLTLEGGNVRRKGKILLAIIAFVAMYVAHSMAVPEGAVVLLGVVAVVLSVRALSGKASFTPALCAGGCGRHIKVLDYGRAGG